MNKVVVIPISEKFTRKEKKEEEEFTRQTTGLVTAEQFKRKKKELVDEISDATDRARQQRFIELSFFLFLFLFKHTHTQKKNATKSVPNVVDFHFSQYDWVRNKSKVEQQKEMEEKTTLSNGKIPNKQME